MYTPIHQLNINCDNTIYVKREDLLPFSFGGNKARIANEFFLDMEQKNCDCIIGYGNTRSNLSRAIANMSASKNIPCYIVSPSDSNGQCIETSNSRMVQACGAKLFYCTKENVAKTVEKVMLECAEQGLKPYYIYGDIYGKGNEAVPVRAYEKVYSEIMKQQEAMSLEFDYIMHASGTGMTQAGLIAGKHLHKGYGEIVGISIAREKNNEIPVIKKYITSFFGECENISNCLESINFIDEYLCEGYGKYNEEILKTIKDIFVMNGLPLDTTYTGKAFYGMLEYLKKNNIKDKNILFIHTGGTPLFFDGMEVWNK